MGQTDGMTTGRRDDRTTGGARPTVMSIQFSCFRARRQVFSQRVAPVCARFYRMPKQWIVSPTALYVHHHHRHHQHLFTVFLLLFSLLLFFVFIFALSPFTRRRLSSSPVLISTDSADSPVELNLYPTHPCHLPLPCLSSCSIGTVRISESI